MTPQKSKKLANARHRRVRQKVVGSRQTPRMSVKFSGRNIYVQFVDDLEGKTVAHANSLSLESPQRKANAAAAVVVGQMAANAAKAVGISKVVFDRGGARYHGKVRALADAARNSGLIF